MNILVFTKSHSKLILSPFLKLQEYKCHCTRKECTRVLVLDSTVKSFNRTRVRYKKPIKVNSAFRCQEHNKEVGGLPNSFHKIGAAMDLRPVGDFSPEELDILEGIALLYFDTVLRYEGFIHCHNLGDMNYEPSGIYKMEEQ